MGASVSLRPAVETQSRLNLGAATLVTAESDDLEFTLHAVRDEHASAVPLSVDFEGANSSAIIWARTATLYEDPDGDAFWLFYSKLSDVVSQDNWSTHINADCILVVPVNLSTDELTSSCYLIEG